MSEWFLPNPLFKNALNSKCPKIVCFRAKVRPLYIPEVFKIQSTENLQLNQQTLLTSYQHKIF